MRTYLMKDKVNDIYNMMNKINKEISKYTDLKGPFILLPSLSLDSLEIIGALPGIKKDIDRDKFTKNTNWEHVRKVKSSLKYVADKIRNIEW